MVQPPVRAVSVLAFFVVWALWCFVVIVVLVPFLEQHLRLNRAVTAWFLSLLPAAAVVIRSAIRLQKP